MTYSQALEAQTSIRRLLASPDGQAFLRGSLLDADQEGRISRRGAGFEDISDLLTFAVVHGEPYYWAPDICRLVADAAPSLPSYTLRREVLPSDVAYFHFASSLGLPPRDGDVEDLAGIGCRWDGDSLLMTFFTNDFLPTAPGVPLPVTTGAWRAGQTWQECLGWLNELVAVMYPTRNELMVRYMAACLAFIEQPYFRVERMRPERSTRKRALAEWGREPAVNVIQLRRAVSAGSGRDGGEGSAVGWSCQWPVRPHWRMQACGQDRAERRPVLVRGYLKGDPSKPLKAPSDRLFVVTR